jgi:hypothetical protein
MRVRCSFCGADYEAAVTRAGLLLVGRCERCGRTGLRGAEDDAQDRGDDAEHDEPRRAAP